MRIRLCDNKVEGHHKIYFTSLLKLKGAYLHFSKLQTSYSLKKNPIQYWIKMEKIVKEYLKNVDKEIIHVLAIDGIYIKSKYKKKYIIGTLHQLPNNKVRRYLLKKFSKNIKYLVVHSKFLGEELKKIGIENIKIVNYPSFYSYKNLNKKILREKYGIKLNKIVLSCLGGTRKDKGLNIVLESLKYLKPEIKEKIIFNIAGKEEFYKIDYIESYKNKAELKINLKVLSDEEFKENVFISDIMIIPYLKSFAGNSGPMTEAIVNKIPCITPKELNIGKITIENNLGEVFECENSKNLAEAIERTINNLDKGIYYNTDFYKELTEKKFLESYKKIYEEVWSELENE